MDLVLFIENSITFQCIKEHLKIINIMDGVLLHNTVDNSNLEKDVDGVIFIIRKLMIHILDFGKMIKCMVWVHIIYKILKYKIS